MPSNFSQKPPSWVGPCIQTYYGWFIRKFRGNDALEHCGDVGGVSAHTWCCPEEQIFIAVSASGDFHEPAPDTIAKKIAKIIFAPLAQSESR